MPITKTFAERMLMAGAALAFGLGISACSSVPTEQLLISYLDPPPTPAEVTAPEADGSGYRSIYAKRYPRIVDNAPPAALPARITAMPIRVGKMVLAPQQLRDAPHTQDSQLFREFYDAADSPDAATAERRWQSFINKRTLPGGEYDCPNDARLCDWANEELKRARHLRAGRFVAADQVEEEIPEVTE